MGINPQMTLEDVVIWRRVRTAVRVQYYVAAITDFSLMQFAQNHTNQTACYSSAVLLWIPFRGGITWTGAVH